MSLERQAAQDLQARLRTIAESAAARTGVELVEVKHVAARRHLVQVIVDKVGGVTIAECESVSRRMSADLDVEDLIDGRFTLEVSSPGIDRPLKTPDDFRRKVGRKVALRYEDGDHKRKMMQGNIDGVDADAVIIEGTRIAWQQVIDGKLIV